MRASPASINSGKPVVASGPKFWAFNGGPYAYPHSGYAWAWQRQLLDRVGGLFEYGGMGSGDHHMALGMVGKVDASLPGGVTPGYRNAVTGWANLASNAINGKLGFAYGTIEHPSTAASPTAAMSCAGRCSSTTASTRSLI